MTSNQIYKFVKALVGMENKKGYVDNSPISGQVRPMSFTMLCLVPLHW